MKYVSDFPQKVKDHYFNRMTEQGYSTEDIENFMESKVDDVKETMIDINTTKEVNESLNEKRVKFYVAFNEITETASVLRVNYDKRIVHRYVDPLDIWYETYITSDIVVSGRRFRHKLLTGLKRDNYTIKDGEQK